MTIHGNRCCKSGLRAIGNRSGRSSTSDRPKRVLLWFGMIHASGYHVHLLIIMAVKYRENGHVWFDFR